MEIVILSKKALSWVTLIILMAFSLVAIIWACTKAFDSETEEREQEIRAASQVVEAATVNSFIKPITVAKVMANDVQLKNLLKKAETAPAGEEVEISNYLSGLKNGLGYKMMFAVCDNSGAYYTSEGMTTNIYDDYDGNSKWYGEFLSTDKEMEFNVDIEESTGWELSVFVNQLIKDDRKNVLGVVGTGVEMSQLQSLLEKYERVYQVKIDITDANNVIQVDTDTSRIGQTFEGLPGLDLFSDGESYFQKSSDGDKVITYMEDIDMYLVVSSTQSETAKLLTIYGLPLLLWLIGAIVAFGLMFYVNKK